MSLLFQGTSAAPRARYLEAHWFLAIDFGGAFSMTQCVLAIEQDEFPLLIIKVPHAFYYIDESRL